MWDWTGNPFIDTGIVVMIARAKELGMKVFTLKDLSPDIVETVFRSKFSKSDEEFSWLTKTNQKLKCYTMVFSSNGPLTNVSSNPLKNYESLTKKIERLKEETEKTEKMLEAIRKLKNANAMEKSERLLKEQIYEIKVLAKKRQAASKKMKGKTKDNGLIEYLEIIKMLIEDVRTRRYSTDDICEITGKFFATSVLNIKGKNSTKEWFPLTGTLSDAQTLPSASRSLKISAFALLAVQLMPMAAAMLNGKVVCFQSNDMLTAKIPLFQKMAELIYFDTLKKVCETDAIPAWGKKDGYTAITNLLLTCINTLTKDRDLNDLPQCLSMNFWIFSNTGQEPYLEILELQSNGLIFLWNSWISKLKNGLSNYLEFEIDSDHKLLECIIGKCFYGNFHYFDSKLDRATALKLHDYYAKLALGYSKRHLDTAKSVAMSLIECFKSDRMVLKKKTNIIGKDLKKSLLRLVDQDVIPIEKYTILFPESDPNEGYKRHTVSSQIICFYLNYSLLD